jgi:hypothetical protein
MCTGRIHRNLHSYVADGRQEAATVDGDDDDDDDDDDNNSVDHLVRLRDACIV